MRSVPAGGSWHRVHSVHCSGCPYVLPVTKRVSSRLYPRLKDLDEVLGGPSAWAERANHRR
ncbi:Protein RPC-11, partial [Aphelenchoides avenae]